MAGTAPCSAGKVSAVLPADAARMPAAAVASGVVAEDPRRLGLAPGRGLAGPVLAVPARPSFDEAATDGCALRLNGPAGGGPCHRPGTGRRVAGGAGAPLSPLAPAKGIALTPPDLSALHPGQPLPGGRPGE